MEEGSDVSLEKLCTFSSQTQTQITVDAPLHGTLLLLDGKVLKRKSAVKGGARKGNAGSRRRARLPRKASWGRPRGSGS